MENQHEKITGYRDLSQDEIDAMNWIKKVGISLGDLVTAIQSQPGADPRWVAIAKTDLQKGMMALTRAIARPTTF